MPELEITCRATQYEVSALPEDDSEACHWTILVEYRGDGLWAVCRHRYCLGTDGEWDFEPSPSNREDDWIATHRFDLDTALLLARNHALTIKTNGLTAADHAARREIRKQQAGA